MSNKTKKKISKATKALIAIGIVAVVLAVVAILLLKTFRNPHRSAESASNAAFDAVYHCKYKDFVESTIYNTDCMSALGLSITGELHNQIEPYFKELEAALRDSQETYRRTSTKVEEYAKGDVGFTRGVELIRAEYFDVYDGLIEKVARAVIEFDWSYRDESGKKQTGHDSDISWSVCIDGKWYVVPNIDEAFEAQQAAASLADLAELGEE